MRAVTVATLLLAAAISGVHAQSDVAPGPTAWGPAVNDLQMSLYLASDKVDRLGIPEVGLAIRNLGSSTRKVSLGGGCGPQVPGWKTVDVRLILTDRAGRSQELEDVPGPPLIAGCGGAIAIFAVQVPARATVTVPLDLEIGRAHV